jgi:membrane protein YdbS with pleckstrin-like domain
MSEKTHLFDNPGNVRRVLWALVAICGLLFVADFIYHRHIVHPWEELRGFYAIYGFVACVVLVLVAKQMRKLLMRGEDYYESDD